MTMFDWEMEDVNEDLFGNPYNAQEAFAAMDFPMSPPSAKGMKNLSLARYHLRNELEKKRARRCTLEIFQEQFADCAPDATHSTLLAMDDDDRDLMVPFQTAKTRIPRLSPAVARYPKKDDRPTAPRPLASKLVRPTQLAAASSLLRPTQLASASSTAKRPRAMELTIPRKRFQPAPPSLPSTLARNKSRIPLRQVT
ncbi:hypothetical protein, variant [Saprolegnia diclina VS20]|uniref:Uncharacterized protein n=1 Tax=Saprolegnia diclina (strain VS20) TaxID=1156394 RepID=T0S2W8_SAPDV|nr:hypothetical protein, variant [Saprolegnia diclina VS20]XP_008609758.1 hypothetical protein SDRG_05798 [Saprolegnia diclina VS20]EQC36976.1 hypothetical protein SDRG_05798 [Saprolegnia diclina VS20]EQC36977.1 hypothetical protein, variant [Saprolegnia diclina VS20]|eukprot:XP_008609757.1 hypothetical protein, variant [Saprolegnia diclina VS20]